jgi:hypothetical protein
MTTSTMQWTATRPAWSTRTDRLTQQQQQQQQQRTWFSRVWGCLKVFCYRHSI